jgi:hypothetical protein
MESAGGRSKALLKIRSPSQPGWQIYRMLLSVITLADEVIILLRC